MGLVWCWIDQLVDSYYTSTGRAVDQVSGRCDPFSTLCATQHDVGDLIAKFSQCDAATVGGRLAWRDGSVTSGHYWLLASFTNLDRFRWGAHDDVVATSLEYLAAF